MAKRNVSPVFSNVDDVTEVAVHSVGDRFVAEIEMQEFAPERDHAEADLEATAGD